jgi:predicted Zn-dependent peptidase
VAVLACALTARAEAPPGVRLPDFQRVTLANGAEVALLEKRDTPLVSMMVLVRGGALADEPGKEGTAALFAELLQKGAGRRDAAEFAESVEGAGGEIAAAAGTESLSVSASFLAKDSDLMLELVGDALLRPRLNAAEFEKARTLAVQSIAAAKDADPRALIGAYGDAWVFRGHSYGRPVSGDERSLAAVTADDVRRYFTEQVRGDRAILAVVGDFSAADMKRKLETAFGDWGKSASPPPAATAAPRVQGRRVLLVDKPGAAQTYFWLGNVGASRTDPGRTAQSVVNTVFGGRFTSMLNTELRIRTGLTYGAGSAFDRLSQPGAFSIASYTETGKTTEAMDLTLATLDRLHEDGLDAGALASARTYVLGQFPPTIETNGQLAGRLADMLFHGLGRDDVDGFAARVVAVDDAAARSAIEQAFPRSQDLAIVLIGDAALIRERVAKYGPVTEMKVTDPSFAPP